MTKKPRKKIHCVNIKTQEMKALKALKDICLKFEILTSFLHFSSRWWGTKRLIWTRTFATFMMEMAIWMIMPMRVMRNHDLNSKRQIQYKDKDNTITNRFTVTWSGVILESSGDLVSHPTAIPEHAKSPPRTIFGWYDASIRRTIRRRRIDNHCYP